MVLVPFEFLHALGDVALDEVDGEVHGGVSRLWALVKEGDVIRQDLC